MHSKSTKPVKGIRKNRTLILSTTCLLFAILAVCWTSNGVGALPAPSAMSTELAVHKHQKRFLLTFLKSKLFINLVSFASAAYTAVCTVWKDHVQNSNAQKAACYAAPIVAAISTGLNLIKGGTNPTSTTQELIPLSRVQGIRTGGRLSSINVRDVDTTLNDTHTEYYWNDQSWSSINATYNHFAHPYYGNHTVVTIVAQRPNSSWSFFETVYISEGHVDPLKYLNKRDCTASNSELDDDMGEGDDFSECSDPLKHKFKFSGAYNRDLPDDVAYEAQQYDGDSAHENDAVTLANTLADDFASQSASQACMCMEKNTDNETAFVGSLEYDTSDNATPPQQNKCLSSIYNKNVGSCESLGYSA